VGGVDSRSMPRKTALLQTKIATSVARLDTTDVSADQQTRSRRKKTREEEAVPDL
jgi:hypothetical protein